MAFDFIAGLIKDLQRKYQLFLGPYPKMRNIVVEPRDSLFVEYENGLMFRWSNMEWHKI